MLRGWHRWDAAGKNGRRFLLDPLAACAVQLQVSEKLDRFSSNKWAPAAAAGQRWLNDLDNFGSLVVVGFIHR